MKTNLSNSVADAIILKIKSGEYKENDRLPSETELERELGVSRTTIREAIKILVSKNVVTIRRGIGTFVNENPGAEEDMFALDFLPEGVATRDVIEFRYYVDPIVSSLAAQNATEAELLALKDVVDHMYALFHNPNALIDHQLAVKMFCNLELLFHGSLYDISHNALFRRLRPSVMNSVYEYYIRFIDPEVYDLKNSFKTHESIYLAVSAHDAERAYEVTRDHMADSPKYIE